MKTKTEHTPGPWHAGKSAGYETHGQMLINPEADGRTIAVVYNGAANARLIAAAPELLEALQRAESALAHFISKEYAPHRPWTDTLDHARAAIAKAKGEA